MFFRKRTAQPATIPTPTVILSDDVEQREFDQTADDPQR
jgi:hypothetical protein